MPLGGGRPVQYVRGVSQWLLARRHAFDALIVLGAIGSALEVAFENDPQQTPTTSLWFAVPACICATGRTSSRS